MSNHCTAQYSIMCESVNSESDEHQDCIYLFDTTAVCILLDSTDSGSVWDSGVCVFVYLREEFLGHMVLTFNWTNYCQTALQNEWSLCCQQPSIMISVLPTLFRTSVFINFNGLCSEIYLCYFNFYYPDHYWIWISSICFLLVFLKLLVGILHQFLLDCLFLLICSNSYTFIHSLIYVTNAHTLLTLCKALL